MIRYRSVLTKLQVETILIAIPSATSKEMRKIMDSIRKSNVKDIKVVPGLRNIMEGKVSLTDVKEISIEDIIGREQASINHHDIEKLIKGKEGPRYRSRRINWSRNCSSGHTA